MRILFADRQINEAIREVDRDGTLVTTWERVKTLLTVGERLYLENLWLGPKPNTVVHVLDSAYALDEVGVAVLTAPRGIFNETRSTIYLMPTARVETLVHEYLHFLFNYAIRRDIPIIATDIAKLIESTFGVRVHPSDVETSLRANEHTLIELLVNCLTATITRGISEYPITDIDSTVRSYATLLASQLNADLDLRASVVDLANTLRWYAYTTAVRRYREGALHCVNTSALTYSEPIDRAYRALAELYTYALACDRENTATTLKDLTYCALLLYRSMLRR